MKKTRDKIFITIFMILTSITIYVFLFSFYQNYKMQKDMIKRVLKDMNNFERDRDESFTSPPNNKFEEKGKRIYLGFNVYTVVLDNNGLYKEIINHTKNETDLEDIEVVAKKIIKNHKSNFFFGNLLSTVEEIGFGPRASARKFFQN